jgi:formiminotetrahydrofolate cyclodeaminase
MTEQSLPGWLDDLASAAPAPGGGAAAAMSAALGAALVEMVANLTIGKSTYAEHQQHVESVLAEATQLRHSAVALVDADATAFTALMATYKLPKETDEQKAVRRAEIQRATAAAAEVPLQIGRVGAQVVDLAAQLPGRSNPNVLSDVAVAASSAVAAIESAAVNVEINLSGIRDKEVAGGIAERLAELEAVAERGRALVTEVRAELTR